MEKIVNKVLFKSEQGFDRELVETPLTKKFIGVVNPMIEVVELGNPLTIGKEYVINEVAGGDDFGNVGYVEAGAPFIAIATIPTTWESSTVFDVTDSSIEVDELEAQFKGLNIELIFGVSNRGNITNGLQISSETMSIEKDKTVFDSKVAGEKTDFFFSDGAIIVEDTGGAAQILLYTKRAIKDTDIDEAKQRFEDTLENLVELNKSGFAYIIIEYNGNIYTVDGELYRETDSFEDSVTIEPIIQSVGK